MKKNTLIVSMVGLILQSFGLGFMLYGINNNEQFTWIGIGIMSFGLMIIGIGIGLIFTGLKKTKKE